MSDIVAVYWLAILVVSGAILAIAFVASGDGEVARRVFARFLFNIFLPLVVLFGVPLLFVARLADLDERVLAALIGGLVIAAGWLTSAIFSEIGKSREREEKLRDYHKALYAEIRDTLASLYGEGKSDADGAAVLEQMNRDDTYVPFIAREEHNQIFRAIQGHIEFLPRQTIDIIVAYYSQVNSLQALSEDMRDRRYSRLSQKQRIAMYEDYLALRLRAFETGLDALRVIDAFSEGGAEAAQAKLNALNTPDAVQTGRQRESE